MELPFIPGACVLTGVLSPAECRQLVAASESIGYRWCARAPFLGGLQAVGRFMVSGLTCCTRL